MIASEAERQSRTSILSKYAVRPPRGFTVRLVSHPFPSYLPTRISLPDL